VAINYATKPPPAAEAPVHPPGRRLLKQRANWVTTSGAESLSQAWPKPDPTPTANCGGQWTICSAAALPAQKPSTNHFNLTPARGQTRANPAWASRSSGKPWHAQSRWMKRRQRSSAPCPFCGTVVDKYQAHYWCRTLSAFNNRSPQRSGAPGNNFASSPTLDSPAPVSAHKTRHGRLEQWQIIGQGL